VGLIQRPPTPFPPSFALTITMDDFQSNTDVKQHTTTWTNASPYQSGNKGLPQRLSSESILSMIILVSLWISSVSMMASFVAIENDPSPTLRKYHNDLAVLAEKTGDEAVVIAFALSVASFTISAKHLYTYHGTRGAVVMLGTGLIMAMESWVNATGMTPTEKCLVLIPWIVSMGMTGLMLFRRPVPSRNDEVPALVISEKQSV